MESYSLLLVVLFFTISSACTNYSCQIGENCSTDNDCAAGLNCFSCVKSKPHTCTRFQATIPNDLISDRPFNGYSWLVTHNSFCNKNSPSLPGVTRNTLYNQEDTITHQLSNGVRGLILEMYEFNNDIWLCRSPKGNCSLDTAFGRAIDTLKEVGAFLDTNSTAIITIFIKDHVRSKDGLPKLFLLAGLDQYRFPLSKMPRHGDDWPMVYEMVKENHRLLVFTSDASKEKAGFAYQWRFVLENKYGDFGMHNGSCEYRDESKPLTTKRPSLFLMNHWLSRPSAEHSCNDNLAPLVSMVESCKAVIKYPNYIAVDYYMRNTGGGVFNVLDHVNCETLCGSNSVNECKHPIQCSTTPVPDFDPFTDPGPGPEIFPPGTAIIHCPHHLMPTLFYLLIMAYIVY